MRVETSVAIEFAVSCKPLRKIDAKATSIKSDQQRRFNAAVMASRQSRLGVDQRLVDDD